MTITFHISTTVTSNVVLDKLNCIEESLYEIRDKLNWFKPHNKYQRSSSLKSYEGVVLRLWNEFKQFLDANKKLNETSLSEMYCKVKSEIEGLGKGNISIGVSTVKNFYKCKTNPKIKTLRLMHSEPSYIGKLDKSDSSGRTPVSDLTRYPT